MSRGIYAIVNARSGLAYVGSTVGFRRRWKQHKTDLRGSVHHNSHLQHSWSKYGESVFEFLVCEYVKDKEQLHVREQYWLDWHRLQAGVYNHGPCARHPLLGTHPTEEHRRRISKALTGCSHSHSVSEETRQKMSRSAMGHQPSYPEKPYPAFTHRDTGEIIPAGVNMSAACREYGLDSSALRRVATGEWTQYKGWELRKQPQSILEVKDGA